jgi:amidase
VKKSSPSLQQLARPSQLAALGAMEKPELPSLDLLRRVSRELGLALSDPDLEAYQELMRGPLASFEAVASADEPTQPIRYPREEVRPPRPEENPHNAWYWRCSIKGADEGPLRGKRLVVKDNICVAGVPMMNGSRVLEGYVPDVDATVVTRVLDAGAEIVGKGVCEHLSAGGSSFTSDTGPVRNPHDPSRSAGGSTSGPAALVASGEAELALGTDQGGSIRIPSAWCGIYGLKPTYGLVPYTGISSAEQTQDHVGLIADNTMDLALLLQAVAGQDYLDPRQSFSRPEAYTRALTGELQGVRVGVLEEGFAWPNASEEDVDAAVREAASRLAHLGASVKSVSIPAHRQAHHIWRVIGVEGRTALMFKGRGMGTNWKGYYTLSLLEAYARGFREKAHLLSEPVKLQTLLGEALLRLYDGRYYARAQNLALGLRQTYDEALASTDVLLMPTTPMKATLLPDPSTSWVDSFPRNLEMTPNTAPFNVTGHPALSVPCALSQGLPVGMMLIGQFFNESMLLRVAGAFEAEGSYIGRPGPPRPPRR